MIESANFHTKLPRQEPMLRQIEWGVHNGFITKNGVYPVTNLFFLKVVIKYKSLLQKVYLI